MSRNPAVENQAVDRIVRALLFHMDLPNLDIIIASPGTDAACHDCEVDNREFYRSPTSRSTEKENRTG